MSHKRTKKTDELLLPNACCFEGYRWYMPSVCRVWRCDFPGSAYEKGHVTPMRTRKEDKKAKEFGIDTVPMILGPVSYLLLSELAKGVAKTLNLHSLLDAILPIYKQVVSELEAAGVTFVHSMNHLL